MLLYLFDLQESYYDKLFTTALDTFNLETRVFFGRQLKGWDEAFLQNKAMK